MKKIFKSIGSVTLYIYFLAFVFIATPYFNWRYATEHGFASWFLFGEVVATTKATIWPYYIVRSLGSRSSRARSVWTQEEKHNSDHFMKSLEAAQSTIDMQSAFRLTSQEEMNQILHRLRNALDEAELVMDSVLDKANPELKNHFRNEYQKGLALKIRNIEEGGDWKAEIEGGELLERWGNWYNSQRRQTKIPK